MKKIFIIFFILFSINTNANELKSLKESFKDIKNEEDRSLLLMQRCAAIYGALSAMPPTQLNPNELETRYKIFLQSAVSQEIQNEVNIDEEESYKKQLDIFKSSLVFFIQIFDQNYKKSNSYFNNTWVEKDYNMCQKL